MISLKKKKNFVFPLKSERVNFNSFKKHFVGDKKLMATNDIKYEYNVMPCTNTVSLQGNILPHTNSQFINNKGESKNLEEQSLNFKTTKNYLPKVEKIGMTNSSINFTKANFNHTNHGKKNFRKKNKAAKNKKKKFFSITNNRKIKRHNYQTESCVNRTVYFNDYNYVKKNKNRYHNQISSDVGKVGQAYIDIQNSIIIKLLPHRIYWLNSSSDFSPFSTTFQFIMEGKIFESVENYYQYKKICFLAGDVSGKYFLNIKFNLRKQRQYLFKIRKMFDPMSLKIHQWRRDAGLQYWVNATIQKFQQNLTLLKSFLCTDGQVILHCHYKEAIDACGGNEEEVLNWVYKNNGKTLAFPAREIPSNYYKFPIFYNGKNAYGVMLMQIRKYLIDLNKVRPFS